MSSFIKLYIFWSFFLLPNLAICGWLSEPNDYNSCILESMKGVTSDIAAKLIRNSCERKFLNRDSDEVELLEPASNKIEGKIGSPDNINFAGTIFNGNKDWNVSSLEIRITDKETKAFRDYKVRIGSDKFNEYYSIKPTKMGEFFFRPFEIPKDYSWKILKVYGYQN